MQLESRIQSCPMVPPSSEQGWVGTKLSVHESLGGLCRSKPQDLLNVSGIVQSAECLHREKTEFVPRRQSSMSRFYLNLTNASCFPEVAPAGTLW